MFPNRHGQHMAEYALVVAAVVVVLVIFLGPTGLFRGAFERTLEVSLNQVNTMARNIDFGTGKVPP